MILTVKLMDSILYSQFLLRINDGWLMKAGLVHSMRTWPLMVLKYRSRLVSGMKSGVESFRVKVLEVLPSDNVSFTVLENDCMMVWIVLFDE